MAGRRKLVWVAACLLLTGCGAAARPSSSANVLSEEYEGALPVQTQLIVGTLKLEDSGAAVTAAQAAELVPLWEAVRSLSSSDSASQVELDALYQQIQETMTADQLQAIASMQLTQQDLFGVVRELGLGPAGAAAGDQVFEFSGQGSGRGQASGGGQASSGGPPAGFVIEGGPPEGFQGAGPGGGQFFSQDLDPDQVATLQAERGGAGARSGLFLIDPLVEMLKAKAGA